MNTRHESVFTLVTSLIRNKEGSSLSSFNEHIDNTMRRPHYCLILLLLLGFLSHVIRAGECGTKTSCNECMEVLI